jgi:UDP-3-O-acyl N-acetylglucosamine deacetylase
VNDTAAARTIAQPASLTGLGLHTGRRTTVRLLPEFSGRGVRFVRTDLPGQPAVAAGDLDRAAPPFRTALKNGAAEVHTVEHLLAAFAGMNVTDCTVEIDGLEVPGMDGSALPFAVAIRDAGCAAVPGRRVAPLVLAQIVSVEEQHARIEARPHAGGLKITYQLDYPGHALAQGTLSFELTEEAFVRDIAPARTFVLRKDAEAMRAAGLGKGADCQNTVVIDGNQAIDTALRFPNEPVRHKILDLLGDLYILGRPLHAEIVARCSGHRANRLLALRLLEVNGEKHG